MAKIYYLPFILLRKQGCLEAKKNLDRVVWSILVFTGF